MKDFIQISEISFHYRSSSYNKINRDGKEREVVIYPRNINYDRNKE